MSGSQLNVLFISSSRNAGGAEICSMDLVINALGLNKVPPILHVISKFRPSLILNSSNQQQEIIHKKFSIKYILLFIISNIRFRHNTTVFSVNTLTGIYNLIFYIFGFDVYYLLHDDYSKQTKKRKFIIILASLFSKRIICPCVYSKDKLPRFIKKKTRVIFNRVNFKPVVNPDEKSNIEKNEIIIINVGRIEKNKNQLGFLKVVNSINKYYESKKKLRVRLVGDISDIGYFSELERFATEHDIKIEHVQVERKDMPKIYSNSDLLIHTSKIECLPTVLIEAVSSGIPVFASDVGGVKEILHSDFIFPVDSEPDIQSMFIINCMLSDTFHEKLNMNINHVSLNFIHNQSHVLLHNELYSIGDASNNV